MATTRIPALNLRDVHAAVGSDEGNQPTLEITDGTTTVVLGGGENAEVQAGMRRISEKIWDYQLLVAARREAVARVNHLAERYGVDGPTTSEASVKDLPPHLETTAGISGPGGGAEAIGSSPS